MKTANSSAVVCGGDDMRIESRLRAGEPGEFALTLYDSGGGCVLHLLLSKSAAECLYSTLWAMLCDSASAQVGECDLTEVARMGEGDDGHQPVGG